MAKAKIVDINTEMSVKSAIAVLKVNVLDRDFLLKKYGKHTMKASDWSELFDAQRIGYVKLIDSKE